jgi:hypothetical protein
MEAQWVHAPPQTLESLYAQDSMHSFLYDDRLYANAVKWAIVPRGTVYLALPIDSERPREILGSTVVIPVTLVPADLV